jgi:hypothetical protein
MPRKVVILIPAPSARASCVRSFVLRRAQIASPSALTLFDMGNLLSNRPARQILDGDAEKSSHFAPEIVNER